MTQANILQLFYSLFETFKIQKNHYYRIYP